MSVIGFGKEGNILINDAFNTLYGVGFGVVVVVS